MDVVNLFVISNSRVRACIPAQYLVMLSKKRRRVAPPTPARIAELAEPKEVRGQIYAHLEVTQTLADKDFARTEKPTKR